ncbi:tRNA1(Val) (adenine(37)-N6)-methyltransferase [Spiroplasma alleghenense]|uniref:Methyltransferase n=1 Tax=Spiroplasma alleghenense TaxID=216931 RepID=A0A345Z258_9MOLU|nr:tRNA1(Val) (adenine(37)-N6)-methyltransferase [Spiroplasma alleghenense]AXK50687.1 methyltransferase [Spiroplasma alleghenense]
MKILNTILGYKDLEIYQDTEMFRFSLDSILLARFVKFSSKIRTVVDFGTNNAVIPLIISRYTKAKIIGVEIQKEACQLADENIILNKLENQIEIENINIKDFSKLHNHNFDLVLCNPPFFKVEEKSNLTKKSELLTPARHEIEINLEEIVASGSRVLKQGGRFAIVHRAERFSEILDYFKKYELSPKNIQFIYSKAGKKAKTVLIDGIYKGNNGIEIKPPLITHNENGDYSKDVLKLFED